MGRPKSSSTTKNALITQFFKKPEANVKKQPAKNDENALTEQEIQERNRRLSQRVDQGDHKKKRPILRPALSDKSGLGGGLGTKHSVKVPSTRQEPTCNVLCDSEEPIKDIGNSKSTIDIKAPRTPLHESQVETAKVSMPKSWATSKNTLDDDESSSPTRSRDEYNKSETVARDTNKSSSISSCIQDQSTARVKKRRIEDELLLTTTKRKVLSLKPSAQQPKQQSAQEEQHQGNNKTTHITIYPDNEEDATDPVDSSSPSSSQDYSFLLSPERQSSLSSPDAQLSPECPSYENRSPTNRSSINNSSPDRTLPLSFIDQYEEHVAVPVPRGRNLLEKLGIKDHASSQSSSHSTTDNDEQNLA